MNTEISLKLMALLGLGSGVSNAVMAIYLLMARTDSEQFKWHAITALLTLVIGITSVIQLRKKMTKTVEDIKAANTCGTAVINVHIGTDGNKQVTHVGYTAYGKGYAPKDGHKPLTIIKQEPQGPTPTSKSSALRR